MSYFFISRKIDLLDKKNKTKSQGNLAILGIYNLLGDLNELDENQYELLDKQEIDFAETLILKNKIGYLTSRLALKRVLKVMNLPSIIVLKFNKEKVKEDIILKDENINLEVKYSLSHKKNIGVAFVQCRNDGCKNEDGTKSKKEKNSNNDSSKKRSKQKSTGVISVGVDIEELVVGQNSQTKIGDFEIQKAERLVKRIAIGREKILFESLSNDVDDSTRGNLIWNFSRTLFSIKEAAYKAVFNAIGVSIDFKGIEVAFEGDIFDSKSDSINFEVKVCKEFVDVGGEVEYSSMEKSGMSGSKANVNTDIKSKTKARRVSRDLKLVGVVFLRGGFAVSCVEMVG